MAEKITCPKCAHVFAPSDEMSKKLRAEMDDEYAGKVEKLEREFQAKVRSEISNAQRAGYTKAEEDFNRKQSELEESLKETKERLGRSQDAELQLRKQQRELEVAKQEFELLMTRKLDEERGRIKVEAEGRVADEFAMKQAEWQKKHSDMETLIADLKRKAEQGSQQAQGEVLELEIESVLKETFIHDSIEPVSKGIKGGDVLQRVMTRMGQQAGAIIWEIKRTKAWSDGWVPKLKIDQRAAKAELAVIITTVLPEGVEHIGIVDGVWVTDIQSFSGLALALRSSLLEVTQARQSQVGKNEKLESLYIYLSGAEFRGRIESIVESFTIMKEDLEAERRAIEKSWAKREKSIARVLSSTAGMHGEFAAILGASLQEIPALMLENK